ncbi:DNA topoisomerase 2 [Friedmanniomyces endolithicus]|uniref:DNA topoisomerase 2 n=1 Tax=Friedmanniomyces endolithicus TaxID=329885 RepID=A0A4U0UXS7_9PEZI|nr:DNA topoisomerase 2 [Friedmanniomyces endolithicus]TKA40056.1 DNA topoisomerase 2 [Friedmanniomyces endolithicus]
MDSDVSAFEVDASSDFEAPKAKVKAPAKKAAASKPKAAPKQFIPKATKGAAAPKTKKRSKPESDEENSDIDAHANDDSLLSNTPPSAKKQKKAPARSKAAVSKPLMELENESFNFDGAADEKPVPKAQKKGTSTEQYQKLTQLEHILKRPDTYIGSVERTTEQMWVFNSETEHMENRKVSYVPGLYKIFDEILVNAADNKQRDKNMTELRVWVDREHGVIAVKNNGRGIPVEMHEKEGIYIPEMIFGHLLTSSNYDDEEAKVTGGRNGYGAKLTNIYSTRFDLETVDSKTKQKYKQTWQKNMSQMGKAKIEPVKGTDDYTKITFKPDFAKFGMDKMDDDFEALVKRRVYDMAGTCTGVKVWLNDQRIKVSKFKQYMEMYTKAIQAENLANGGTTPEQVILTDNPHERWEIGFAVSDGAFQQVSFVNSIATTSGGSHVNYIADQICEKLEEIVNKKNKGGVKLKKAQIKNHIFLFVNALIVNPAFTSQTKEQLTTKPSAFGSKPQVSEKFLKDIAKTEAVTNILHFAQQKADKVLSKSDGNRRQRMNNSKLTDANKAGTKDGWKCTLILTEGDSASLLALAGRAVVDPDLFGVFPLRGKMLNVRDATIDQISKNAEIQNIKKFMGLQHKKEYTDAKSLRYGHLMIMTDQDHDGSHIKGLLINFLQVTFPSLLRIPGFLLEFITPIVKVWKGDPKHPKMKKDFFTMPEYEAWKLEPGHGKGWDHKYYKGLGTSDTRDAQIYFGDLDKHLKRFHRMQEGEPELLELAFAKKKADARKLWLQEFVPGTYLDMSGTEDITYDSFINKELILFSMADNMRSIPSVIDGFKPSQRKVLYTCFRRNLKKDVKVVELAGSVSGLTAYAYGETSLQQTIVGLAQNFVGSNNINCLEPSGNFGSRLQGGNDAASARYIYTRLSPFARRIFHQTDEALLSYNTDDGKTIEPECYIPIVPMILINGADGIGTGWSTSIPNYKPEDIIDNLKRRMQGDSKDVMLPMQPWFRDWTGVTEQTRDDQFKFTGTLAVTGENTVEITELPVRVWTQDFKDRLEEVIKAEKVPSYIKDYTEYNTPEKVHFIIKMEEKNMMDDDIGKLAELFKLSKPQATSNLVAFDHQGRIHKYATPLDIMEEFYQVRLQMYQKRKQHMLQEMERELQRLTNQARFVKMIIDGQLTVSKKKKAVLVAELQKLGFTRFPKVVDAKKEGEFEAVVVEEGGAGGGDDDEDAETTAGASDYDYLLGMAIWSLTQERVERLMQQIGAKEQEIDVLTLKSPKDLWTTDLDELLEEWVRQLEEEAAREKKVRSKGRRASAKLGFGAKGGGKKRKAGEDSDDGEDSDFGVKKARAGAAKAAKGGLLGLKVENKPAGVYPRVNGVEQKPVVRPAAALEVQTTIGAAFEKAKPAVGATAAARMGALKVDEPKVKRKKIIEDDDDFDDVDMVAGVDVKPKVPARAAATVAKAKAVASDDDDEMEVDNVKSKVPAKTAAAKKKALMSDTEIDFGEVVKPRVKAAASKSAPKKVSSDSDSDDFGGAALTSKVAAKPAGRGGRAAAQKPKRYAQDSDSDSNGSASDDDVLEDVTAMVKGIGPNSTLVNDGPTRLFHPPSVSRPSSSSHKLAKASSKLGSKKITADSDVSEDETNWEALARNSPQKAAHHPISAGEAGLDSDDDDELLDLDIKARPKPVVTTTVKPAPKPKAPASKVKESAAQQLKQKPVQKKTLVPSRLAAVAPPVAKPLSPAAKAYAAKQAKAGAQTAGQGGKAKAAGTKRLPVDSDTDEGEEEEDVDALANEILSEEDDDDVPVKKGATGARPARRAAAAKPKAKYALDDSLDAEEDDEESEADFEDEDED